ncbi:MAG TPA: methyl-accepting chemotaxis protein [Bacteroidales bacterium]|jgi:methyl-accepting chemotaxis protein|nr:methyl-accepting chemotaxis protein [Bacteroidales bacterium]
MAIMNSIKIGRRLTFSFLIFVLYTIAGIVFVLIKMQEIGKQIDEIYKVNLLSVDYLIEADRDAYQSNLALTHAMQDIIYTNKAKMESATAAVWENYDQIGLRYGKFEKAFRLEQRPEYTEKNSLFHQYRTALKSETENILDNLNRDKHEIAEEIYYSSYDSTFQAMRAIMDEFTGMSLANADKYYADSKEIARHFLISISIINLIIILLIIFMAIALTRSITKPLSNAVSVIKNVANGDLTKELEIRGKDEIAELMSAVSNMISKLKTIINGIIESSESLSAASEQISNSSQQLSDGATEQASSTEEISSSMEEMVGNIQQNTDNAKQTELISGKATESMVEMSKIGRESFDSIKTIAEKITIINDIAFQTNLLALNAAVEAARAGEHGRGFAVVAAEVRKLAERSKLAADEIESLSKNSLKITEKTRESLDSLVPEIQKTSQLVQEIAAASIEQNSGADQINSAIQQLNVITQQNAASSEEMASSAEQLSAQAENLKQAVAYFKIDESHLIQNKFSKKGNNKEYDRKHIEKVKEVASASHRPVKKDTADADFVSFQ